MESRVAYRAGAEPTEAACECGWKFGRIIRRQKRTPDCAPLTVEYMVLYACNLRVYKLDAECPGCGKKFVYNGKSLL